MIDLSSCGLGGLQVVRKVLQFPGFEVKFMEMTMDTAKVYLVSPVGWQCKNRTDLTVIGRITTTKVSGGSGLYFRRHGEILDTLNLKDVSSVLVPRENKSFPPQLRTELSFCTPKI